MEKRTVVFEVTLNPPPNGWDEETWQEFLGTLFVHTDADHDKVIEDCWLKEVS